MPAGRRARLAGVATLTAAAIVLLLGAAFLFVERGATGPALVAADSPRFAEVTATSGIDHTFTDGPLYYVGGGVAAFDCDGDARPELYLAGGAAPAALFRNRSPIGGPIRFERLDVPALELTDVTGAYPLDIDGDGITDLAVLRTTGNVLLKGLGDCDFQDATRAWGLDGGDAWTTAFSATWEAGQTWPTLAFGNYLSLTPDRKPNLGGACTDDVLVRPVDGGTGYASPTALSPSWCTLSMLFSDWGRTGRRDLRVSNDRHYYSDYSDGQEQLWRMRPGAPPSQYTEADGWQTVRIEGMGIASQDISGDGLPEVYLTSQAASRLDTLADGPTRPDYRDMALQAHVDGVKPSVSDEWRPSTAWDPQFEDVNHDGLMDLFVTKGNVSADPDFAQEDPNELYLGQPDGTFQVVTRASGLLDVDQSRGAALVDLDLDGLLDVVVVEHGAPVRIWRNMGGATADGASGPATPMGHWVGIQLHQDGTDRDAIGSWIEVRVDGRVTAREVTVGGGHASGRLGPVQVGLGPATSAEVRVQWPDGEWGPWQAVGIDQYWTIQRGSDGPQPWDPGTQP